jgi:hypothetical protein
MAITKKRFATYGCFIDRWQIVRGKSERCSGLGQRLSGEKRFFVMAIT